MVRTHHCLTDLLTLRRKIRKTSIARCVARGSKKSFKKNSDDFVFILVQFDFLSVEQKILLRFQGGASIVCVCLRWYLIFLFPSFSKSICFVHISKWNFKIFERSKFALCVSVCPTYDDRQDYKRFQSFYHQDRGNLMDN